MVYKVFSSNRITKIFLVSFLLALASSLAFFFFLPWSEKFQISLKPRSLEEKNQIYPPFEKLLLLKNQKNLPSLPNLCLDFELSLHPCRADENKNSPKISLFIKSSSEKKEAFLGEKVYLYFTYLNKPLLHFSEKETELWVLPTKIDGNAVQFEVDLNSDFAIDKPKHLLSFRLNTHNAPFSNSSKNLNFNQLSQAKWWGIDQERAIYAPEDPPLHRLEMETILSVQENTLLIFKDSQWQILSSTSSGYPLARIKKIAPKIMEIECWDETGCEYFTFNLILPPSTPLKSSIEDQIGNVRLRTLNVISLSLEKEPLTLKKHDWIAKIQGKWKVIKSQNDLNEYLEHRFDAELFVFDGIERSSQKKVLKGHHFNPMRTEVKPVSASLNKTSSNAKSSAKPKDTNSEIKRSDRIKKSLSKLTKNLKGTEQ